MDPSDDILSGLDVAEDVSTDTAAATETPATTETPAAAAPAAEAPKVEAPKEDPKPEPSRTIPLASHLEERRKWERDLAAETAARKQLEERLTRLEKPAAPPTPPTPEPDFVENPKGYVDTKVEQAVAELKQQVQNGTKTAEQAAQEAQFTRFMSELQTTEAGFVQKQPDYYEALTHLRQVRFNELSLVHPDATEQQLIDAIRREELGLAQQLTRMGKNPHEIAYQIAKTRGYTPKAAAPAPTAAPQTPAPQLPQVNAPKQLSPTQTLGSSDGGAASEVDAEEVDPFDRAMKEVFGSRKRA